jgi:Pectinacetylesterase
LLPSGSRKYAARALAALHRERIVPKWGIADMRATARLLMVLVCVTVATGSGHSPAAVRAAQPKPRVAPPASHWVFIRAERKTGCARGGRFGFWVRRAAPQRLLLYFQPGGGCFNYATCVPGGDWFDDHVDGGDSPARLGGILDPDADGNPFKGWSIVFIPSCTGDVHIGSRTTTYRSGDRAVTIHHFGWINSERALSWAYAHFRRPETVFVAGSSAGSVGSAFHAPEVIHHYRRAVLAQLGDSLAFVFDRPLSLREYAGLTHLPRWLRRTPDVQPGRFTMISFMAHLVSRYPRVRFARFDWADDAVQQRFYAAVGGNPADFHRALAGAEAEVKARSPGYRSYTACGTSHIVLSVPAFFTLATRGVAVRDWVAALAKGRDVLSVSC